MLDDIDTLVGETDASARLVECQRVCGRIAVANGEVAAAERWFETAITTAHRQSAALFGLRAVTQLTELLTTQDGKARQSSGSLRLMSPFTQGRGTPDLTAAMTLLDRLRTP